MAKPKASRRRGTPYLDCLRGEPVGQDIALSTRLDHLCLVRRSHTDGCVDKIFLPRLLALILAGGVEDLSDGGQGGRSRHAGGWSG